MGEPEMWIVAVGNMTQAAKKVNSMLQMAFLMRDCGVSLDAMLQMAHLIHDCGV